MGFATRLFIADPDRGWRRLSLIKGYFAFHDGTPIPEFASQTIHIGFAHVEVKRNRVVGVLRLERDRWRFDREGVFDRKYWIDEQTRRYWPGKKAEMEERAALGHADIQQIKQSLGIRVS